MPHPEKNKSSTPLASLRQYSNFFLALYFGFKVAPSLGGILALYLGYRLFILGVTGQASLTVNSNSISGRLLNAAPGLFFAVGGIVILVAVVWKGVNLEVNNSESGSGKVAGDAIKKGEPPTYLGGGGGGGSSLKAGGG
jgi:hypothetical protein